MKRKSYFIHLLIILILASITSACTIQSSMGNDMSAKAFINNPVRDTLFITLPDGYNDETCSISIRSIQADFVGSDIVIDNRLWFNVRHLPSATYLVWIKVGDLYFSRRFVKI